MLTEHTRTHQLAHTHLDAHVVLIDGDAVFGRPRGTRVDHEPEAGVVPHRVQVDVFEHGHVDQCPGRQVEEGGVPAEGVWRRAKGA